MDKIRVELCKKEWQDLLMLRDDIVLYAVYANYAHYNEYSKGLAEDFIASPVVEGMRGYTLILEAETLVLVKDFLYDTINDGDQDHFAELDLKRLANSFGLVI